MLSVLSLSIMEKGLSEGRVTFQLALEAPGTMGLLGTARSRLCLRVPCASGVHSLNLRSSFREMKAPEDRMALKPGPHTE